MLKIAPDPAAQMLRHSPALIVTRYRYLGNHFPDEAKIVDQLTPKILSFCKGLYGKGVQEAVARGCAHASRSRHEPNWILIIIIMLAVSNLLIPKFTRKDENGLLIALLPVVHLNYLETIFFLTNYFGIIRHKISHSGTLANGKLSLRLVHHHL